MQYLVLCLRGEHLVLKLHSLSGRWVISCQAFVALSENLRMTACMNLGILFFLRDPGHVRLGRRLAPTLTLCSLFSLVRIAASAGTRLQSLSTVVDGCVLFFKSICGFPHVMLRLRWLVAQKLRLVHKLLLLG